MATYRSHQLETRRKVATMAMNVASEANVAVGDVVSRSSGAVTGAPRAWLRMEGLAALVAGGALFLENGGWLIALVPLLLAVDVSMVGYLAGPRAGALGYNVAHSWATGLLVLGTGAAIGWTPLVLAGAVLVAHVGMDRLAGYGLKYPTGFGDTHLGRIGRHQR
jgi:hypothetical protein